MSHDCIFISRRTSVAAVGLGLIGVVLFCMELPFFSPARAAGENPPEIMLAQPASTTLPTTQTANSIFLPLVAHESDNELDLHHESAPPLVIASSDHNGHSATPPPAANSYTFIADQGGHLDDYWYRNDLPAY